MPSPIQLQLFECVYTLRVGRAGENEIHRYFASTDEDGVRRFYEMEKSRLEAVEETRPERQPRRVELIHIKSVGTIEISDGAALDYLRGKDIGTLRVEQRDGVQRDITRISEILFL